MLAFYWKSFDFKSRPTMRNLLFALTAFVVTCYLTILFDDTFFCGIPVSIQWSQDKGACSVFYAPEPFILNFTLNLTCYLVVYAIPLILLTQGGLRASKGVSLTFTLGGLTIASSIVRFVTLKVGTGQENLVCKSTQNYKCTLCVCFEKFDTNTTQIRLACLKWPCPSLSLRFLGWDHFLEPPTTPITDHRQQKNIMRPQNTTHHKAMESRSLHQGINQIVLLFSVYLLRVRN